MDRTDFGYAQDKSEKHIPISYPGHIPIVRELQDVRNFVGQTEEQRRSLESKIKERYKISDFEDGNGYLILDTKNNEQIYFGPNPRLTLERRYLEKDENRHVTENILDLFARVAVNIAEADLKYKQDKDIIPIAEEFLKSLIYKEFMPNTPTLCNAGRSLQQLSACFVLPVEDYLATDDIGEDPEKQGCGIYDAARYMAMIHKSGGGTGFNFSHLRPRSDRISTTFGSSSGPLSFTKSLDGITDAVNQGGFRRGANMAILNYIHPDIFEFVSEKARNKTLKNFNLSAGIFDEFMGLIDTDDYFKLINPKGENKIPLEQRLWKDKKLLIKGTDDYNELFSELEPSLVISEDGKNVINVYNEVIVGKIDDDGSVLISARKLFDYIAENAWAEGCPGVVFLDRLERNNKTPHIGKIESTNPCGEQPLLPFEACNLGAINLASCVKDGGVDYDEINRRIKVGVHFLDNVIDMSRFPFKRVYGMVHGTRKIGLGLMGWAEMLVQLKLAYDSDEAISLARKISGHITETARGESEELAKERGVFPFWEGSVWEKQGRRVRNATVTTIAPNGTTGMICDASGGIEPFFKLAFRKTCMNGRELIYNNILLESDLRKRINDENRLEKILNEIKEKGGSIQNVDDFPEDLKIIYKTAHDISPEWHVKMQAAFQSGIDNAVSKTVNLPESATVEDVKRIYRMAYDEGCMGITIFRDKSKIGVYSTLERKTTLVQNNIISFPVVDIKDQSIKYKIKRRQTGDSLHVIMTSDLYVDDKNKKAYFIPAEIFQVRAPLGHATSVSFAQSGMDRTEILRGPDPDYSELVVRLQSASSNEEEGIGPRRIKSIEHAVGLVLEDYLLRNGIISEDERGKLVNVVRKPELRRVEKGSEEYNSVISQVRLTSDEELTVKGNHGKLGRKFVCEGCGCEEYEFIAGCNHPICKGCGEVEGGGCG